MPSAYPFQTGLIGKYHDTPGNPGVYISWDSDTSFSSTQFVIFKGNPNSDFNFPLIIDSYSSGGTQKLNEIKYVAAGQTYIYCLNEDGLIAYRKRGDSFITSAFLPNASIDSTIADKIKVSNINGSEFIIVGLQSSCVVLNFNGTVFTKTNGFNFSAISGITTTQHFGSDFSFFDNKFYFSYQDKVYAGDTSLDGSNNLVLSGISTGVIIDNTNGLESDVKLISSYDSFKIGVVDTNNNITEFLYQGNIGLGNTTSQWSENYTLAPESQNWSAFKYNNFGVMIATDSVASTINVIVPSDDNSGNGTSYNINQPSTSGTGLIINSVGSVGFNYLQFNGILSIAEDSDANFIIADQNQRLTYFPTSLSYVANVYAPVNEYIDATGNPADVYVIKQTNQDYSAVKTIPPILGDELLIRASVLYELNALMRVPIYDEEVLFGYERQSATLAYGDLAVGIQPEVRISCSTFDGSRGATYTLNPYVPFYNSLNQSNSDPFNAPNLANNYPNGLFYRFNNEGKMFFFDINGNPVSVQNYDIIVVSYYVSMFTNRQINNALYLALQAINSQPGLNKIQTVSAAPFYYDAALVTGATYYLLRQLINGLNQRERRLLVMDPENNAFDAISNLRESMKTYKEEFDELLKQLPKAQRPMMGTITTPPYAIPGGRNNLFRTLWKGGAS